VYHKGATTVRAGGDWSPTFRLGTNNVLAPNFLALVFKKQEISQQDLASEFSKIFRGQYPWTLTAEFPGVIPPDPHSGRGRLPPAPNTQPGLWPGAGRKRPGVGTQTLWSPSTFQPWLRPWCIDTTTTEKRSSVFYG